MLNEPEARTAVIREYVRKYGPETNVDVETFARSPSGTLLAVVRGTGIAHEYNEVCLVTKTGDVRIFDGTGDLAHNLATLNTDRLTPFSSTVVSAVAFLLTLIAVIAFTWMGEANENGLQALTGILGLAAGFYFGNQSGKA